MIVTKKKINTIITALMADIKSKSGLPVNNYDPDNLTGSFPEVKLRFNGMQDVNVNINGFMSVGSLVFDLYLVNEILNIDTVAATVEATIKLSKIIHPDATQSPIFYKLDIAGINETVTYKIFTSQEPPERDALGFSQR